jgi:hypothetical protein
MKPFKILVPLSLGVGLVAALLLAAGHSPAQAQGDPGKFVVDLP